MLHWPFRVTMTVATLLLFDQAIFAGRILSGSFPALQTHRDNATTAGIAVLAAALGAIPIRWPGRGPLWPALAGLGLFGLIALQIVVGFRRLLIVHVPLGVSIIVLAVLLTGWAWRYRPVAAVRPRRTSRKPLAGPGEAGTGPAEAGQADAGQAEAGPAEAVAK